MTLQEYKTRKARTISDDNQRKTDSNIINISATEDGQQPLDTVDIPIHAEPAADIVIDLGDADLDSDVEPDNTVKISSKELLLGEDGSVHAIRSRIPKINESQVPLSDIKRRSDVDRSSMIPPVSAPAAPTFGRLAGISSARLTSAVPARSDTASDRKRADYAPNISNEDRGRQTLDRRPEPRASSSHHRWHDPPNRSRSPHPGSRDDRRDDEPNRPPPAIRLPSVRWWCRQNRNNSRW